MAALAAFRTGKIDCGRDYDDDFLTTSQERLKREFPEAKFFIILGDHQMSQFMNREPWTNKKFRQAVSIATDRFVIFQVGRLGLGRYPPNYMLSDKFGGS